jgi:hypothetical protein
MDTATDPETNARKGLAREQSLVLQRGLVADDAVVKRAQTFRFQDMPGLACLSHAAERRRADAR